MSLYEIRADGLVPFRQLLGGAEMYEQEIEDLLWENLDDLVGEPLFRLRRQAPIAGGGRPDIVALDRGGSVVVIEVKRDVDRSQLAQCLEYAGWAHGTSLDEIAGLYHRGADLFWADWQEYTTTDQPVRLSGSPRLVLIARDFAPRTNSALEFLTTNRLPISVLRVSLYLDEEGRRFLDIDNSDVEVATVDSAQRAPHGVAVRVTHQISLADLLGAGVLQADEPLRWERPRMGQNLTALVTHDGRVRLSDGSMHSSLSGAAGAAAGGGSFDGWESWRVPRLANRLLADIRREFAGQRASEAGSS